MAYNAGERKDIRRAEKSSRLSDRNRGEVLMQLMSTVPGRAYIFSELERCHLFSSPYSPDTNQMYFRLGEQNKGLELLRDLMTFTPDEFLLSMREANARRTEQRSIDDIEPADNGELSGRPDNGRDAEGSETNSLIDDGPEPRYLHEEFDGNGSGQQKPA